MVTSLINEYIYIVMDDSEISILDSMRFDFKKNLDFELRAIFAVY